MRPILHPSLCHTWRDESTLQIGATPGLATVLAGLGMVERRMIAAMDGQHDLQALRHLAVELGGHAEAADRLVDVLLSTGSAVDAGQLNTALPPPQRSAERSRPDQCSIGLQQRSVDGGESALQDRQRRHVEVIGAGRVGAQVARLLATAGMGQITVDDPAPVQLSDICPGGLPREAMGQSRARAVNDLVHTDLVQTNATASATERTGGPDFVVIAPVAGTGRDEAAELMRLGIAHLLVQVVELTGIVGPLVLPGESSCLRCHDLRRADRDRHWPLVLDQLTRRPPAQPACDVTLCATVAGIATAQTLAHLDGFATAAVDGTVEVSPPYGLPRRRTWKAHPDCGCSWS